MQHEESRMGISQARTFASYLCPSTHPWTSVVWTIFMSPNGNELILSHEITAAAMHCAATNTSTQHATKRIVGCRLHHIKERAVNNQGQFFGDRNGLTGNNNKNKVKTSKQNKAKLGVEPIGERRMKERRGNHSRLPAGLV
jgi:hypothetical protein